MYVANKCILLSFMILKWQLVPLIVTDYKSAILSRSIDTEGFIITHGRFHQ